MDVFNLFSLKFQINNKGSWEELLSCFDIEESTLNGALALKQVYLRYLEPYEKIHYQVRHFTKSNSIFDICDINNVHDT